MHLPYMWRGNSKRPGRHPADFMSTRRRSYRPTVPAARR